MSDKKDLKRGQGRHELFVLQAAEYYIAGRYSLLCVFVNICGLLFHHGFEMLLKADIVRSQPSMSFDELTKLLRRQYGHDLNAMWATVKGLHPRSGLDDLDGIVNQLNSFEDVRYPLPGPTPTLVGFTYGAKRPQEFPVAYPKEARATSVTIDLGEVDALFTRTWRVLGFPTGWLKGVGDHAFMASGVYSMYNILPLFPPTTVLYYKTFPVDEFPPPQPKPSKPRPTED
jgi:hypothetical protein